MGNCMQTLSETVTLLASDDTWIEGSAIQQLHTSAALPGMARVAGMPTCTPAAAIRWAPPSSPSAGCIQP